MMKVRKVRLDAYVCSRRVDPVSFKEKSMLNKMLRHIWMDPKAAVVRRKLKRAWNDCIWPIRLGWVNMAPNRRRVQLIQWLPVRRSKCWSGRPPYPCLGEDERRLTRELKGAVFRHPVQSDRAVPDRGQILTGFLVRPYALCELVECVKCIGMLWLFLPEGVPSGQDRVKSMSRYSNTNQVEQ